MPMKLGQQQRKGPGRGSPRGDKIQINCNLDPETFKELRNYATQENLSLAETIRLLLQWGLDAADQP